MAPVHIVLIVVALLALWAVGIYNRLVARRQMSSEAWSGIDVQLKRRSNLIPNLVKTVEGYMGHESDVLTSVTAQRTAVEKAEGRSVEERGEAENGLSSALMNLFAVAENYPDLKASSTFAELQKNLSDIEEQIQLARRYYNGAARDLNILVESFPSNIIANLFRFDKKPYFELANAQDAAVPQVDFDRKS